VHIHKNNVKWFFPFFLAALNRLNAYLAILCYNYFKTHPRKMFGNNLLIHGIVFDQQNFSLENRFFCIIQHNSSFRQIIVSRIRCRECQIKTEVAADSGCAIDR
jgi:hypothetical protein